MENFIPTIANNIYCNTDVCTVTVYYFPVLGLKPSISQTTYLRSYRFTFTFIAFKNFKTLNILARILPKVESSVRMSVDLTHLRPCYIPNNMNYLSVLNYHMATEF